jgi:hypothetical protein
MRRKIADQSVRFRRCAERGSVGLLVDGREPIVDDREHLEHVRMRPTSRRPEGSTIVATLSK